MRYVELFAGAGGMSMGLEAAGMHPVAHAEIEPHARAVLRQHWPETPLHGDVTQVDWTQYAGQVDLVAGGSPCQDLSVAGKRAGLAGARSGLFFELIRAWEETGAPYCLWENVDGARSSNGGEDFAAVLSAFVGNPVAVPRDKRGHARWPGAGVAAGSAGVAAWRVLDLQHFGPPQRRRRLFVLAARTGGCDPAEILLEPSRVCGHPAPRDQQRQGAARGAAGGAGGSGAIGVAVNISDAAPRLQDVFATLQSRTGSGGIGSGAQMQAVLAFQNTGQGWWNESDVAQTLRTPGGGMLANVLSFTPGDEARGEGPRPMQDLVQTLGAYTQGDQAPHVLAFTTTQTPKVGGDVALTLEAASRSGGGQTPAVLCLASGQANAEVVRDVVGTLDFGGHGGSYNGQDAYQGRIFPAAGRPRRLTPLECERLMGWPDRHTAQGVKEDGTAYALSDTARYRLCGNGVGAPVAAWIGQRLVAAEASCPR